MNLIKNCVLFVVAVAIIAVVFALTAVTGMPSREIEQ